MKDPNWRQCILRADSRDVLKKFPDNSIDLILTDPPYNLGQHSTGNIQLSGRSAMNNDVAEWDMVDFNPEEWADEFIRILKPTGNLFIFTSYNQLGRWYNCLDHRFDTSNFMIWHKTNPAPKIFKAGFLNSCEMIFTCWNKKHTWNFISQSEMHNFIESPICMRPERLSCPKHPAQKPVSILKKLIKIASNEGDIIFDPFMGVGSTGVAALQLNRKFIGVEIDTSYFYAAQERITNTIKKQAEIQMEKSDFSEINHDRVCEATIPYLSPSIGPDILSNRVSNHSKAKAKTCTDSNLTPIIKWPGGKEKELKYIIPNIPKFDRYFEPFVGGGAVYMGITAKEYYINDFSQELMELYSFIANKDKEFFDYAEEIDKSWGKAKTFVTSNPEIINIYLRYRNKQSSRDELKTSIHTFCANNQESIIDILGDTFKSFPIKLLKEIETNLSRKMARMRELEIEKHELPDKDLHDNIEAAIKSALYMNYRYLYNDKDIQNYNKCLHCALFLFIRNYAYSGMFRYSSTGDFNVPYGGIAYNNKYMTKKLNYYRSEPLLNHFSSTHMFNSDFEDFLRSTTPSHNDFVFLDPPYDSEFSTYAKNPFTKADQIRLADYMINECQAKWMLVIKNTEFIYSLYNRPGINIKTFDKEYLVSFMNRNDKKVTHLLITNY